MALHMGQRKNIIERLPQPQRPLKTEFFAVVDIVQRNAFVVAVHGLGFLNRDDKWSIAIGMGTRRLSQIESP